MVIQVTNRAIWHFTSAWRIACPFSFQQRDAAHQGPLSFLDRPMLREFTDKNGVEWLVWDVYPDPWPAEPSRIADIAAFPHRDLSSGWLCFESRGEKRRVAPIPAGWEVLPPERLEALCSAGGYITHPKAERDANQNARDLR